MKPIIYCTQERWGTDTFYLQTDTGRYYLFHQAFRFDVHEYFRKGVAMDKVFDFTRCRDRRNIVKTQTKIPMYIRYAESEYGIIVLDKTQRHMRRLQSAG